jgi:hypothetical protein
VKIRGSALQVADKYAQLARDAQSAGDRVMAENYFQHAEHYYRIVAAAYEQQNKDKRDDQGDRSQRFDDRNEQPAINGYDGVDDDGMRRTVGAGNGADHDGEDDGEEAPASVSRRGDNGVNGSHYANGGSHQEADAEGSGEDHAGADERTSADAEAAPEEPKPKRRTRATRSRSRTRKTEGSGDGTPASSEPETAESTS